MFSRVVIAVVSVACLRFVALQLVGCRGEVEIIAGGSSASASSSGGGSSPRVSSASSSGSGGGGSSPGDRCGAAPAATEFDWAAVSAGDNYTCALKLDHTLWCWGYNDYGQLGDGTTVNKHSPAAVTALGAEVKAVSAGEYATCAIKLDGTLWCWGSLAEQVPAQVVALGSDVAEVAAGYDNACARKKDGTVWCFALVVGDSPKQSTLGSNVAQIAMSDSYLYARKTDGTLWRLGITIGPVTFGNLEQVTALGDTVAEIAANLIGGGACAVLLDDTLWCWQDTTLMPAQIIVGAPVAQVSLGDNGAVDGEWFWCARGSDGTLWCWGSNYYGQLGRGAGINGSGAPEPVCFLGAEVTRVSADTGHVCALKADHSLWCWGSGGVGEIGDGATTSRNLPVPVD